MVGKAYVHATIIQIAINSFRKTGSFPCIRNIFEDHQSADSCNDLLTLHNSTETQLSESNIFTFNTAPLLTYKNYRFQLHTTSKTALIIGLT